MKYCLVSLSVLYLIVMFSLIGVGCTPTTLPSLTATRDSMTPLNSMPTTLPTPTQTITPINSTPSVTPLPTEKSETFTPTPTPQPTNTETPLPIPTAPGTSVTEQVLWLFETNNGCQLPCWWGITPGQTSWETAKEFLSLFDQNIYETSSPSGLTYYGVSMPVPPEIFVVNYIEVGFLVREGIVEEITSPFAVGTSFPVEHFMQYTLLSIFVTYGEPEEIWLSTYNDTPDGSSLPFIVTVVYFDQGILASYRTHGETQNNLIRGCFSSEVATWFQLSIPELYSTFQQATNGKSVFNRDYLSLEEATSMDVATFYETFKNPDNTVCIETPSNLWKP